MKIRDSGMPEEAYWESLFNVPLILDWLGLAGCGDVAELGCGYGTFTVPIAQTIGGTLTTIDVDPEMIARTRQRATGPPVVCELRDVMEDGFGVQADAVLLFNLLHCERPVELLRYGANALRDGGRVFVIHWRHCDTPRGPRLDIRPKPEQIIRWAVKVGLTPKVREWLSRVGVTTLFIEPGSPWENGHVESFNGKLR
jgi:SAM-dependent methyltransferase